MALSSTLPASSQEHVRPASSAPRPVLRYSEAPFGSSGEEPARARFEELNGKRVVIVEDEGLTQMQLRRALSRAGLDVIGTASNGQEGVAVVLAKRPDLVLMDIRMPVMDGLEALEKIMEASPACVVMLTAFADAESRETAARHGASGYVVKPVTGDTLLPELAHAYAAFLKQSES